MKKNKKKLLKAIGIAVLIPIGITLPLCAMGGYLALMIWKPWIFVTLLLIAFIALLARAIYGIIK